jgi:hypothetical protein
MRLNSTIFSPSGSPTQILLKRFQDEKFVSTYFLPPVKKHANTKYYNPPSSTKLTISTEIKICKSEIREAPGEGKNSFRKCSYFGFSLLDSWLLAQLCQLFVHFVVALLCNFLGFQVQPQVVLVYGQPRFLTV